MSMLLDYTLMWNTLHFPSGVVPVTQVLEGEETYEDNYNDSWTKAIKEDIKGSLGMPLGV